MHRTFLGVSVGEMRTPLNMFDGLFQPISFDQLPTPPKFVSVDEGYLRRSCGVKSRLIKATWAPKCGHCAFTFPLIWALVGSSCSFVRLLFLGGSGAFQRTREATFGQPTVAPNPALTHEISEMCIAKKGPFLATFFRVDAKKGP